MKSRLMLLFQFFKRKKKKITINSKKSHYVDWKSTKGEQYESILPFYFQAFWLIRDIKQAAHSGLPQ